MTPEMMHNEAVKAQDAEDYLGMVMTRKKGSRMPPGFPSGTFLSETEDGRGAAYSYDPDKVIIWLESNNLI